MDKIEDLMQCIDEILGRYKKSVTLKKLQSLIGKLNFACRAVRPGRVFNRRLINATMGASKPFHRVRVTHEMCEDLRVWRSFLSDFNGISVILPRWESNEAVAMYTDASGALGYGAYVQGHWSAGTWPEWILKGNFSITFMEMLPIVLAVYLWGPLLANKIIVINCDNEAVVECINKQTSRSKPVAHLIRIFVLQCLNINSVFRAKHVPGSLNEIADSLSRLQWEKFKRLAPQADVLQTPVPDSLWQLLKEKSGG